MVHASMSCYGTCECSSVDADEAVFDSDLDRADPGIARC